MDIFYNYVAYNENREIVKGKLEAKNEEQAASLLTFAGYQVVNLKQVKSLINLEKLTLMGTPVKPNDIIMFYRQVALLIDSGLNIVTSIELLEQQTTNKVLQKVLGEVVADIRAGSQLSSALAKHPQIFSQIDCQSLKVGEQTGGMESILRQIADHMEKQVVARKGVKNAMTFPVITLVVAVIVVGVLITFVLPAFANLYASLGSEMPLLVKVMMSLSGVMRSYGIFILIGVAWIGLIFFAYIKTTAGRLKWDQFSLNAPMVGRINHLNELARVCRSIAILFKAGLPLTEIMPLVIQSTGNKVMANALVNIRDDMLGGEGLSRPMAKHEIFLPMMVQMVRVGEETGNLDSTMNSVAQSYEAEADDKTKAMIGMIQPVMTIAIGVVVAIVALTLVSSMFSMYNGMG